MKKLSLWALACACLFGSAGGSSTQESSWENHIAAGRTAWEQGRTIEAEERFAAALLEAERFGPHDPRLAESLHYVATVHLAAGRLDQAELLALNAVEIREVVLGSNHPLLAQSLNLLAAVHHLAGDFAAAEPLYLRSLAIAGGELGMSDPNVAATLLSLSALYIVEGRSAEAIPLQRWALAVWEKTLGPHHPLYRQLASQNLQTQEAHQHAGHGSSGVEEAEMGFSGDQPAPPALSDVLARDGMGGFALAYFTSGGEKRPVFDNHYDELGAGGILDFLEAVNPMCHEQAHDLGQVVLAHSDNLGAALRQCLTRCTSACMHGILKGALAENPGSTDALGITTEVAQEMAALCDDPEMRRIHKPGNCAHGMGHAFLMNTRYELAPALEACSAFAEMPMEYHCATGIFMEYLFTGRPEDPRLEDLHFPCDTFDRFPAACYRYKAFDIIRALGDDREKAIAVCLELPRARRLGCFHGIGASYVRAVFLTPGLIKEVCLHGTRDDQTMCIEGVIEKLGEYDEAHALAACNELDGELASVCRAAAEKKMYPLTKPSFSLYFPQ